MTKNVQVHRSIATMGCYIPQEFQEKIRAIFQKNQIKIESKQINLIQQQFSKKLFEVPFNI